jgi:hypothetical protein
VVEIVSELFSTAEFPSITPIWVQTGPCRLYGQKGSKSASVIWRSLRLLQEINCFNGVIRTKFEKWGSCLSTVSPTGCGFPSCRENATAYTESAG